MLTALYALWAHNRRVFCGILLQYAFNLFSHNSPMTENGYNEEEMKMVKETRKILGAPDMQVHSCPPAMLPAWLSSGTTLKPRLLWVENESEARGRERK